MQNVATVPFHNTTLMLIDHEGQPYVAMRPVVDGMGMDWASQYMKLQKSRWTVVEITTVAEDGKQRQMICLPLRKLPGWLMTLNPNKVRRDIRDVVIAYQNECDDVLWAHWNQSRSPASDTPTYDSNPSGLASAQRAYADWSHEAIARLKQAGVQPPQWPFAPTDHTGLATAVVSDLLARNRWVLSFDHRMQPHLSAVPQDAMILRAADLPEWISTGDIALKVLPAVLEAAGKRLGQALDARREPERLPAPAPVPAPARSHNLRADQWLQARTEATAAELIRDVLGGQPADRRLQMIAGQLFRANRWMPARRGDDRQRIWRRV